jgi:superfamily II DNA or RNA helicase
MQMDKLLLNATCWGEFSSALSDRTNKEKGDAFERLVEFFLKFDPVYRTQIKEVWPLAKVPAGIKARLNLPGPDMGIDLIAETVSGEFWSIQAKFLSDHKGALAYSKLSTFVSLTFDICGGISFALICTTKEHTSELYRQNPKIQALCADTWTHLSPEFFAQVRADIEGRRVPLVAKPLGQHQLRAIRNAVDHFVTENHARGKFISPCGSRKTLTSFYIAREFKSRNVLFVVPSLFLIKQTLQSWLTEALALGNMPQWMCVCSDESAGRIDRDDLVLHVQDLGVPCHTKPDELCSRLKQLDGELNVVFSTYQSSEALCEAAKEVGFRFDLAILDEAHKTTGRKTSLFARLLHDKNIPLPRRMFMTATERQFRGKSDEVVSMDDPEVYGDTFELLTFKEAIETTPQILCDYQVLAIEVRESEVRELIAANRYVQPDKGKWDDLTASAFAAQIALRKAVGKHGVQRTVSFHSSIKRADGFKKISDQFNDAFPEQSAISAFHVSGLMSTGERDAQLQQFVSASSALVTNARCLTEGVDVPGIDCVLFADPKGSTVDVVQAAGRAMRPAPGKTMGHIIVPVLLRDDETVDGFVDSSAFDFVLFVLQALATNDERIVEEFRALHSGGAVRGRRIVQFDLGEVVALKIDAEKFIREVELKVWSRLAKLAPMPFADACALVRKLGLRNQKQWRAWRRGARPDLTSVPLDHPGNPNEVYARSGWTSWGNFFGTGYVSPKLQIFRPFSEAREFVRTLGLQSPREWETYRQGKLKEKGRKPKDIPSRPDNTYKSEWQSWPDWLGYEKKLGVEWRPFAQAREFVRTLKLRGIHPWKAYCTGKLPELPPRPRDIPTAPDRFYPDDWAGWGDWLGTGNISSRSIRYLPFAAARDFVRSLKLTSLAEWNAYATNRIPRLGMRPTNIPLKPYKKYAGKGWISWGDWLGADIKTKVERPQVARASMFKTYEDARAFARALGLEGSLQWVAYSKGAMPEKGKRPDDIPGNPPSVYKGKGWQGWGDFLGTGNLAPAEREFRPFASAREFARSLGFKTQNHWRAWSKSGQRPVDIPASPSYFYKKTGWAGWPDWLWQL